MSAIILMAAPLAETHAEGKGQGGAGAAFRDERLAKSRRPGQEEKDNHREFPEDNHVAARHLSTNGLNRL